ncbi:hypothetical protein [Paenibacillus sambharensis]|uniref:hypothetical protein n=1 Tax=Paenibacillus sambharensis TaxID=1803190 RepID=UPI0015E8BA74|nr:hypothetical protein [Paenibacillus sambharensis]
MTLFESMQYENSMLVNLGSYHGTKLEIITDSSTYNLYEKVEEKLSSGVPLMIGGE